MTQFFDVSGTVTTTTQTSTSVSPHYMVMMLWPMSVAAQFRCADAQPLAQPLETTTSHRTRNKMAAPRAGSTPQAMEAGALADKLQTISLGVSPFDAPEGGQKVKKQTALMKSAAQAPLPPRQSQRMATHRRQKSPSASSSTSWRGSTQSRKRSPRCASRRGRSPSRRSMSKRKTPLRALRPHRSPPRRRAQARSSPTPPRSAPDRKRLRSPS